MLEIKVFNRPDNGRPVLVIYDPIIYSSSTPPILNGPLRQSFKLEGAIDQRLKQSHDDAVQRGELNEVWASFPGSGHVFIELDWSSDRVIASLIREDKFSEVLSESLILASDGRWALATASIPIATGDSCVGTVTYFDDVESVADWLANLGVFLHESWHQLRTAYQEFETIVEAALNRGYVACVGNYITEIPDNNSEPEATQSPEPPPASTPEQILANPKHFSIEQIEAVLPELTMDGRIWISSRNLSLKVGAMNTSRAGKGARKFVGFKGGVDRGQRIWRSNPDNENDFWYLACSVKPCHKRND